MTRRAVFRDDGTGALDDGTGTVPAAGTGFQPVDSDLTAIAALTTTTFGRALLELANAGALQAAADLEPGVDVQAYDADLAAIAALAPTNDDVIQRKAGAWTNRSMAQLIADLAALGTTFQPLDSDLTAIAALSTTTYGRAFLTMADAAAAKTALALVASDVTNAADKSSATIQSFAAGLVSTDAADGVGYATGAGGTVTQNTNKSTGVTLNKTTGQITMNNAALAGGATVAFTLTNSTIGTTDVVVANIASGGGGSTSGAYRLDVLNLGSGGSVCRIGLTNITAGSLSEAVVINFVVLKGASS